MGFLAPNQQVDNFQTKVDSCPRPLAGQQFYPCIPDDALVLPKVVEEANNVDIREIAQQTEQEVVEVETVNGFGPNDVILDIRSIDEQEDKPLKVEGIDVVSLPFYKLSTKFGDLDQNRTWLLWCERGVMSRLQALYLREQGFNNVKVYRP